MGTLYDDLRAEVAARRVLVLVGAGVSIGATEGNSVAPWNGLLKHGIGRCVEVAQGLPEGWAERVGAELESSDLDDLLCVAEKVSRKLQAPSGGEYRRWLRESVGTLRVSNADVLKALAALKVPIATTNYDSLLEEATGLPWVTWKDSARVERVLRGDEPGILHLHGYWQDPESVVLGIKSYETILSDTHAQTLLRAMRMMQTLLFVGFGAGLRDPNFGALLNWSRRVFSGSEYRHFRLARESEVASVQGQHPSEERIFVLSFGKDHKDLAPFLRGLAPAPVIEDPTRSSPLDELLGGQQAIDRRIEQLAARRKDLLPGEYLRELSAISGELFGIGGKRRAWTLLAGPFRRESKDLDIQERLRIGLQLVEMMLQDNVPEDATPLLQILLADADSLPGSHPKKALFWQLQSRCWVAGCAYDQAVVALHRAIEITPDPATNARLQAELAEVHLLQGELGKAVNPGKKREGGSGASTVDS